MLPDILSHQNGERAAYRRSHLTQAVIYLDRVTHNVQLLQELVGKRPLWPAIKANAYGHGADIIARHLVNRGYTTLCVAHVAEAIELVEAGIQATFIVLSATLPENSDYFVAYGFEPVVCTYDMIEALARAAAKYGKRIAVHLKVDTGMGRIGIRPGEVTDFLDRCRELPGVSVKGLMSHFPLAGAPDRSFSHHQLHCFQQVQSASGDYGVGVYHMANSAAIFDLPDAYFDAVRPGIAIYGLSPSPTMANPRVHELKPALEWKTRITYLKDVPTGTGLSYGHTFYTQKPSLIATIPLGYGDGVSQQLSNQLELLVGGQRCPQVGRICMDQSLVDVTALRGRVAIGDEVVIVGKQGGEEVTADELAHKLGTINYEIVTHIAARVPRIGVESA
ncbi:MAG: alanine racemase [Candidatus Tectomicrobia bacterium]|nr:alanine racemase [Candidatus Tectomicrobia bacterium]